jgi:NAD(P)-dependent dehydrogenase (short-subunit alcohol dehydrogenase family)
MSNRFAGKVLLTTGGGSGLAAAVARSFAREGGRVAVLDIDGARAKAVAAELPGSIGLACDVASEEGVRDAVATAHRELGRIDCAFNAAGHADFGPIEEWSLERWNRMMGVHLSAAPSWCARTCCRSCVPRAAAPSSTWPRSLPSPRSSSTRPTARPRARLPASRGQLAREAAPLVRVNVVAPGRIRSGMTEPLWKTARRRQPGHRRCPGRCDEHAAAGRGAGRHRRAGVFPVLRRGRLHDRHDDHVPDGGETLL